MIFEEFVANRLGGLLRYATALTCDPFQADDIVQEVMVRVAARWDRIAGLARPEAYIKRMVLNEYLSGRRGPIRAAPMSHEALDRLAPASADPHTAYAERDALVRVIAGLPPRQRAVIVLRYLEDYADEEIAEMLGCRRSTVRGHAAKALATLRDTVTLVPLPDQHRK